MHAPPNLQNPTALARGGARKWIGLDGLISDSVAEEASDRQATGERAVHEAGAAWHLPKATCWAATLEPCPTGLGDIGVVR